MYGIPEKGAPVGKKEDPVRKAMNARIKDMQRMSKQVKVLTEEEREAFFRDHDFSGCIAIPRDDEQK